MLVDLVSNDGANTAAERLGRGVVTIVPVTSKLARVYPFQVVLRASDTGLRVDSKAQAEQIRSVAVDRSAESGTGNQFWVCGRAVCDRQLVLP